MLGELLIVDLEVGVFELRQDTEEELSVCPRVRLYLSSLTGVDVDGWLYIPWLRLQRSRIWAFWCFVLFEVVLVGMS